ncbi:MAG: hypothetical protein AB201_03275 [Parcubacteria bacterium C7867-006]|nr:MAG: hypothetical protein AB201_03275 [Parcubacteria bacterium C7867-006]
MDGNKISIVTHSSGFHTDDIFAVATLSLLLEKEGKGYTITRSRNMEIAEKADYLVDFGSVYDPSIKRFDHHQEGGAGKRENGIPYASFGLVWKEYGVDISGSQTVAERIDKMLVQPVDFVDADPKGMTLFESPVKDLHPFDLGMIKILFAPTWKEDILKIDETFLTLVSYAKALLSRMITYYSNEVEGEKFVLEAYKNAEDKRLILLENSEYPWLRVLPELPEPLYVVYKNIKNDTWSIKCVRDFWSYKARKDLPESWAGKRDAELEQISGVPGAVFCHNARFMAVNKTKEGILKMAGIALNS